MPRTLTEDERSRLKEFLKPTKIAVVGTIGGDGMPQLTPNWYVYWEGKIAISTTKQRVKYPNLVRDPRLSVCIMTEPLVEEYVTVRGTAEVIDDESIWPITEAIVRRYVPSEGVQPRMKQLREQDRVIISMTPERAHFHQRAPLVSGQ